MDMNCSILISFSLSGDISIFIAIHNFTIFIDIDKPHFFEWGLIRFSGEHNIFIFLQCFFSLLFQESRFVEMELLLIG